MYGRNTSFPVGEMISYFSGGTPNYSLFRSECSALGTSPCSEQLCFCLGYHCSSEIWNNCHEFLCNPRYGVLLTLILNYFGIQMSRAEFRKKCSGLVLSAHLSVYSPARQQSSGHLEMNQKASPLPTAVIQESAPLCSKYRTKEQVLLSFVPWAPIISF